MNMRFPLRCAVVLCCIAQAQAYLLFEDGKATHKCMAPDKIKAEYLLSEEDNSRCKHYCDR